MQSTHPMSTFASADMVITALTSKECDPEKIEKLLVIKGKFEAEENRKQYQIKFAQMQSKLPVIQKTKEVYTKNKDLAYKYAPLEKIIEQIKPILCAYGFSYRWSEGITEDKKCKRIFCHIMGCGHEEKSYIDIPIPETNQLTNFTQMAGSASTYGMGWHIWINNNKFFSNSLQRSDAENNAFSKWLKIK